MDKPNWMKEEEAYYKKKIRSNRVEGSHIWFPVGYHDYQDETGYLSIEKDEEGYFVALVLDVDGDVHCIGIGTDFSEACQYFAFLKEYNLGENL